MPCRAAQFPGLLHEARHACAPPEPVQQQVVEAAPAPVLLPVVAEEALEVAAAAVRQLVSVLRIFFGFRDAVSTFQWFSALLSVSLHDVPESDGMRSECGAGMYGTSPSPLPLPLARTGPEAERVFFGLPLPRNASRSFLVLASRAASHRSSKSTS